MNDTPFLLFNWCGIFLRQRWGIAACRKEGRLEKVPSVKFCPRLPVFSIDVDDVISYIIVYEIVVHLHGSSLIQLI